jgi:hypothetical protein
MGRYLTWVDGYGVAVSGHYAYGFHVIDMSNAADPQRVAGYYTGGSAVAVTLSGNYAYVFCNLSSPMS